MNHNDPHSFDPHFTEIRRSNKAVTDEAWIKSFLKHAPSGVLATVYQDQPFVSPRLFVYDEERHAIYVHSADAGRAWENVQLNPKACFTAYQMGRLLPAETARGFSLEFESVVVFGEVVVVENEQEILQAFQLLMEKYAPHLRYGQDYPPITGQDLGGLAVYRIEILGWSAKQERADSDRPGAYRYEDLLKF